MAINVCNDRSMASITSLPSGVSGSSLVLISEQTASSSATIDFTSNIDDTYNEYVFKFINIHPATDQVQFKAGFRDGGSSYDATKTTAAFYGYHKEDDSATALSYDTGSDLAQSTGSQVVLSQMGNDNDQNSSGYLHLFAPSNTTFVKHFIGRGSVCMDADAIVDWYVAGYCNVTTAIDGVQFSMSSGNIDSGVIKMYGVV